MEDVAADCGISDDDAYAALEELTEWGSVLGPTKKDQYNTYRTPALKPTKKAGQGRACGRFAPDPRSYGAGEPRPVGRPARLLRERVPPAVPQPAVWKRAVILVAGVAVNLLFAVALFVVLFSVIGVDCRIRRRAWCSMWWWSAAGVRWGSPISTGRADDRGAVQSRHAADTVSNSSSIIGIAVMSKDAFDMGPVYVIQFVASISVSLGIMNCCPFRRLTAAAWWSKCSEDLASHGGPCGRSTICRWPHGAVRLLLPDHGEPGHPRDHMRGRDRA